VCHQQIKLERRLWVELSFELKAVMENVHWIVKELVFQDNQRIEIPIVVWGG
jgi:ACT domain-containing protein